MDTAQREFLHARLLAAIEKQPALSTLRERLLSLGGEEIVARDEPDLDVLLQHGEEMHGMVTAAAMRDGACHENVSHLWAQSRLRLVAIGTGYGLGVDGLWRQHSWGVTEEGVIETTEPRLKYFGARLTGREADRFARFNLPGTAPLSLKLRLALRWR